MNHLQRPVGIFDAGIGSYAVVERVHRHFPQQDILYLADRASFPYGSKAPAELLASVSKACRYLESQGCGAIILASNAPSILVFDALRDAVNVPLIGIFPPLQEALEVSASGKVAVLGVQSMVSSAAMQDYVRRHQREHAEVLLVNASPMVELVENFTFLSQPEETQRQVNAFVKSLLATTPAIDVMTLSSTHLPWLRPFFERAAGQVKFLDPADSVLAQLEPHVTAGSGTIRCEATETLALPLIEFNAALAQLNFSGRAACLVL